MLNALDWLINECNVSVINMSCGSRYETSTQSIYYSFLDQYFDCLVSQYRVTIIKSAGNSKAKITSPGFAMNIITVGNLTKRIYDGRYEINGASSYDEGNLPNKPDVVAFGTQVHMYGDLDTTLVSGTGTSYAAPQVTGTVALMMQANSNLIGKPDAIKSILIASAKSDIFPDTRHILSITNNGTQATRDTTDKAGGGLVNTLEAIKQALRDDFQRVYFTNGTTEFVTNRYWFNEDQDIEFTMVYEKGNHTILDSQYEVDINVQILNSDNEVMFDSLHSAHTTACESCPTGTDNVESFKVTLPETGSYTFRIYVLRGNFEDNSNVTIPTIHNSEHGGIYASLNVSCGCDDKNIQSVFSQTYSYEHTCSNCQTTFMENYSYDVKTTNISYNGELCGYVKYTVKFRMNPTTGVAIDHAFTCEFVNNNDSLYKVEMELDGGDFQYTSTGYRQTFIHKIMIYDLETEEYKTTVYDTVHVVYDTRIEYSAYLG